jgi:hypothetical protein
MRPVLRVHIVPVGFQVKRITEPIIRERADKVYLVTHFSKDKATPYLEKVLKILQKEKTDLQILTRRTNIWDFFECLKIYREIIKEEEEQQQSSGEKERDGHGTHIYINVSSGSRVTTIAGMIACMIWKGTPYYAHIDYENSKKDPADDLPEEKVDAIDELPVYSLNKPRPESLTLLQILSDASGGKMKKSKLIEKLEEANLIDKNLSSAAKHSRLKALLHPISIGGGMDNPLVEVEYGGRQSNVKLTSQGESTLKIFGGE